MAQQPFHRNVLHEVQNRNYIFYNNIMVFYKSLNIKPEKIAFITSVTPNWLQNANKWIFKIIKIYNLSFNYKPYNFVYVLLTKNQKNLHCDILQSALHAVCCGHDISWWYQDSTTIKTISRSCKLKKNLINFFNKKWWP